MNNVGDRELIENCMNGDKRAFEGLLSRYEKPVFNAAYRMLNNPEDARDVTQTVFLKVIENLDSFDPKYKFFSWIYRIALNESINCLKKQNRLDPLDREPVSETIGPEEQTGSEQMSQSMQTALMTIKAEYRTVIVLKHFVDCSYEEIGQILNISSSTSRSQYTRARQKLVEILNKEKP